MVCRLELSKRIATPGYFNILSTDCFEAMTSSAFRMIKQIGVETNRTDLLEKAKTLEGLQVDGIEPIEFQ